MLRREFIGVISYSDMVGKVVKMRGGVALIN
jgi:hypothetical protein